MNQCQKFDKKIDSYSREAHCIKIARIQSYSGLHFSCIFPYWDWIRRDTQYLSVFSQNAGKMRTRITPNTDTFYAVGHYFKVFMLH